MKNLTKVGLLSVVAAVALFVPSCKKTNDVKVGQPAEAPGSDKLKVQSLSSSLVAYWPLDGNGNDLSGNGHTATVTGSVTATTDQYGNTSGAMHFDNTTPGSYMTVADAADLRLYGTDYTINAWVQLPGYSASYGSQIMSKRNSNPDGWGCSITGSLYGSGAGLSYIGIGAHGAGNARSTGTVGTGAWHMVSYVYHSSTTVMDMYIDGALDSSPSTGASMVSTTSALTIGYDGALSAYYFNGDMDEIRIYSKALNGNDINALYNSTGLVAYWMFDGNANDYSRNGNNGSGTSISAASDRNSVSNQAYGFNGSSSYVSVPDNTALRLNSTDFTLNAWVKISSYTSNMMLLGKRSSTAGGWGWSITSSGYDFFGPGGGLTSSTGTTFISTGTWHMVSVSYKYSTGTLTHYVDGVAAGSYSSGFPTPTSVTDALYVGRDDIGPNYFFNGAIDDVRIYNKLLSATEISNLYNTNY